MTSGECFENKWFYMKYVGKYLSAEILLTLECSSIDEGHTLQWQKRKGHKDKQWSTKHYTEKRLRNTNLTNDSRELPAE